MSGPPNFDRVLIVATHPDDDVIGAGGLIQHVVSGGGQVRVLFITGGENNVWPQRAVYRKWLITREEQSEWSKIRSNEARMALRKVGIPPSWAVFLGYPDQQISKLARSGDVRLSLDLLRQVSEFEPTLIVSPSHFDVHRDHRATAFFVHTTLRDLPIATYAVHGTAPSSRVEFTIRLTAEERERKREAIGCHKTQLLLSRERFLAHAGESETFYRAEHDLVRIASPLEELFSAIRHSTAAFLGVFSIWQSGEHETPQAVPGGRSQPLVSAEEMSSDGLEAQPAYSRAGRRRDHDAAGSGQV